MLELKNPNVLWQKHEALEEFIEDTAENLEFRQADSTTLAASSARMVVSNQDHSDIRTTFSSTKL